MFLSHYVQLPRHLSCCSALSFQDFAGVSVIQAPPIYLYKRPSEIRVRDSRLDSRRARATDYLSLLIPK